MTSIVRQLTVVALSVVLFAACSSPRDTSDPNPTDRPEGGVGRDSAADRPGPSGSGGAPAVANSEGCDPGFHKCDGVCVDGKLTANCGAACDPCPAITGGEATCDGAKCGVSCPAGKKICAATNACIGPDDPCEGTCPVGKNACNGLCVAATEKTACGPSCASCPAPANGKSECDGTQCVLTCNPGFHRCGDTCVDDKAVATCGVSCTACPVPTGGTATCDGTSCGTTCPTATKLCLGACIASDKPCEGQCPAGKHNCSNNCVADTDVNSCGTTSCMPCSAPSGGKATCVAGACDFTCSTGNKCNGKCVSAENCSNGADDDCDGQTDCADSQCGNGTSCGGTKICRGGACVELKDRNATCNTTDECKSGACVGGHCCSDGEKFCDGQCRAGSYCCNGTACPITNGTGACTGGTCQRTGCSVGYKPQGNECVDVCTGVNCGNCQSCSNGQCVANDAKGGCSGCDRCQGGKCSTKCVGEQVCNGTTCSEPPKKDKGASCGGGSECASGSCVDGKCCENGCSGQCMGCSNALTGQGDGNCRNVSKGKTDPRGKCKDDVANCRTNKCLGTDGKCMAYPNGTQCLDAACTDDLATARRQNTGRWRLAVRVCTDPDFTDDPANTTCAPAQSATDCGTNPEGLPSCKNATCCNGPCN
jgi:hypothetical protein